MKALVVRAYQGSEIRPLSPASAEMILRTLLRDIGCTLSPTGTLITPSGNQLELTIEEVPVGDPVG